MSKKPDKPKKTPKHPEAALYKALRQRSQDGIEFKLRSYFEAEAADCGFASSFETLNHLAATGCGTRGTPDPHERMTSKPRLDAIKFHRGVHAALGAVGTERARVLRAAYGDGGLPIEVYGADLYGPFAGVALLTPTAIREYGAEVARREAALREADAAAMLDRVSQEAWERQSAHGKQREAELQRVLGDISDMEQQIDEANASQARQPAMDALFLRLRRLHAQEREIRDNIDRMLPTVSPAVLAKQTAVQKLKGATIGEWLRSGRSKHHREAIRQEADTMLREARAAFQVRYEAAREELRRRGKGIAKDVKRIRARMKPPAPRVEPILSTLPRGYV